MSLTLVLIRHGHSEWNLNDRFTGWTDVSLTEVGLAEAAAAGRQLAREGFQFDEAHVSVLHRTRQTLDALLQAANHPTVPVYATWRLNERHYGRLQGMNKQEIFSHWGEEMSRRWWRGYHEPPPPLAQDDARHPRFDPLYKELETHLLPSSESLADCLQRVSPYWQEVLAPRIRAGKRTLVVSHGNTLRAMCMLLQALQPEQVEKVEIPSGVPLICRFDAQMRVEAVEALDLSDR